MPPLRGEDLGRIVHQRGKLPPADVIRILRATARALAPSHAAGTAHRDVRPDTIFVREREGGEPAVELLDSGAAEAPDSDSTRKTPLLATPLYLAPEQVRGDDAIGPRADVYALGHVAYTMLAGEPYWQAEKEENDAVFHLLARIVAGPFEPARARAARRKGVKLPAAFDDWFTRATAVDVDRRYASAEAMIDALAGALSSMTNEASSSAASAAPAAPRPAPRGGNALPAALVVGILVLSMGVAMLVLRLARDRPHETEGGAVPDSPAPIASAEASGAPSAASPAESAAASAAPIAVVSALPSAAVSAPPSAQSAPSGPASAPAASASASAAASASAPASASAAPAGPAAGVNACAAAYFPPDTFVPESAPDFAYLCTETDPRRGATATKSLVVRGNLKALTAGKLEWGVLGWYEMPAFAVMRARCCASPAPLKLPPMSSCSLEERLSDLVAASAAASGAADDKLRAAMDAFTKSAACVQRNDALKELFTWKDNSPGGGEGTFLKLVARGLTAR